MIEAGNAAKGLVHPHAGRVTTLRAVLGSEWWREPLQQVVDEIEDMLGGDPHQEGRYAERLLDLMERYVSRQPIDEAGGVMSNRPRGSW